MRCSHLTVGVIRSARQSRYMPRPRTSSMERIRYRTLSQIIVWEVVMVRFGIKRKRNRHVASENAARFFHTSLPWRSSLNARTEASTVSTVWVKPSASRSVDCATILMQKRIRPKLTTPAPSHDPCAADHGRFAKPAARMLHYHHRIQLTNHRGIRKSCSPA